MDPKNRYVRSLTRASGIGLFIILSAAAVNAQNSPPELTTVCAIAKQPDKFDGQRVTLRAGVFSDGMHGSLLYDESCKEYGLLVFLEHGARGGEELDAALNWCHRSTRGKLILGRFTGVFHYKPTYIGGLKAAVGQHTAHRGSCSQVNQDRIGIVPHPVSRCASNQLARSPTNQ